MSPPDASTTAPVIDYDNPTKSRGGLLNCISGTFFIIATICVILRIYSRMRIVKTLNVDDWLIVAAWITLLVCTGAGFFCVRYGFGRLFSEIRPEWWQKLALSSFIFGQTYTPSQALTKLSILFFYLRLSPYRLFHHMCYICIGIVAGAGISFSLCLFLACKPISASWGVIYSHTTVKCLDMQLLSVVQAYVNAITDGMILLLPVPMVWKLNVSWGRKLAVYALLGLGGFVLAISIVRLRMILTVGESLHNEVLYQGAISASWSVIELNIGVVCACVPAIRQLYSVTFPGSESGNLENTLGDIGPQKSPSGPYGEISTPATSSNSFPLDSVKHRNSPGPLDTIDRLYHGQYGTTTDVSSMNSYAMTTCPPTGIPSTSTSTNTVTNHRLESQDQGIIPPQGQMLQEV